MNQVNSDKLYKDLSTIHKEGEITAELVRKGMQAFIKSGHVSGLRLLLAKACSDSLSHISETNALHQASMHNDCDTSLEMVKLLLPHYSQYSSNLNISIKQSIMKGKKYNASAMIDVACQEFKNEALILLVSNYAKSNDHELSKTLLELFSILVDNGADVTFRDFYLYNHALNNKSLHFIKYFCEKHPEVVRKRRSIFCSFCTEPTASNDMVNLLIDAGASLAWLEKRHWEKALDNHKLIYSIDGHHPKEYSVLLFSNKAEQAKDFIPNDVLSEFVNLTIPLLASRVSGALDDSSTIISLVNNNIIDSTKALDKLMEANACENIDKVSFMFNQIQYGDPKIKLFISIVAQKSGYGLQLFSMMNDHDERDLMAFFAKVGLNTPEFANELSDYITICPDLINLIG